jgi:hypothetical protein
MEGKVSRRVGLWKERAESGGGELTAFAVFLAILT